MSSDEDWSEAGDLGLGKGLKPGSLPFSRELPVSFWVRRRSSGRRNSTSSNGHPSTSNERRRFFLEKRKSLTSAAELFEKRVNTLSDIDRSNPDGQENKSNLKGRYVDFLRKMKLKLTKEPSDCTKVDVVDQISEKNAIEAQETSWKLDEERPVCQQVLEFCTSRFLGYKGVEYRKKGAECILVFHPKYSMGKAEDQLYRLRSLVYKIRQNIAQDWTRSLLDIERMKIRLNDSRHSLISHTIATLQGKLDVYQELLYGKYKASEVLLNKLSESIEEHDQWREKWKKENEERQREINELQFKLMCTEGNLTDAQRAWLDRFNSLVKENTDLTSTVHEQAKIMRNLSLEKTGLKRENEELLAMHDAKERIAYQRSNSFNASNEDMGPIELGILGACKCRTANQEPCICAKSACSKHKLLSETQNTVGELEEERNELKRHCQLYRDAFEEQLKRNKMLSKRILLRDHSEPDLFLKSRKFSSLLRLRGTQVNKNEAVDSLVDMVCDRTDALLQQEIMTKILAQRVQDLEK